jgi:hypothetical protein
VVTPSPPHGSVPQFHRTVDLSLVPSVPGIYAWYLVPGAGAADWRLDLDPSTGDDLGFNRLARVYGRHGRRLRHPTMNLDLQMPLWARWQGSIEESGHADFASLIDGLTSASAGPGAKLRETLRAEKTRSILAELLESAAPRLTAPIYVGVAKNLSSRLSTHVSGFGLCLQARQSGLPTPAAYEGSFAERVTGADIREDDLRFAYLRADPVGALSDVEQRALVEAAEFLINRWHRPIFGVK